MKKTENLGYVVFLSVVAAIGGILFGYDTAVISGTTSKVAEQFGLDSLQLGWYVGSALIGSILGVASAGVISDRFGRKKAMLFSAFMFSLSAIGCAVCNSLTGLIVYRIIGGVGIGVVSIVSPIYISEVAMASRRGTLVSLYQLAITVGFLFAYLINFWILGIAEGAAADPSQRFSSEFMNKLMVDEYWRGMLGSETLPALLFFFIIFLIPESPRWLIVKGQGDRAAVILQRIYVSEEEASRQKAVTEASISGETKSEWRAIFSPGIFKAVLIGSAIAILGQFMGVNAVLYYGPEIFQEAGLSGGDALFSQVLVGVVNMGTTVIALLIIDRVGRKTLVWWGVSGMIISLLAIGFYFIFPEQLGSIFMLVFFLFYVFCCAISISAVVFVLLSEMYPNNVRGTAMSIAGLALWVGTYLIGQLTPWLLENVPPFAPAGTFFLFALMCVPYLLIMWKLVPETTGKTLEEIEQYWTGGKKA